MAKILTLNFTTTPIAVDTYAGEIGESGAVQLKVFPQKNEEVAYYGMYFTVEGGILPSRTFDVDEDIEILLTEELTQQDHTDCQLYGINADKTIVDKSPVVRLYFGESLTGDIVVDPITGDTIFDEIAELKELAEEIVTERYTKEEIDELLKAKQNVIDEDNKLDYALLDNVPKTFTPSAHTHVVADITDFPSFDGYAKETELTALQSKVSTNEINIATNTADITTTKARFSLYTKTADLESTYAKKTEIPDISTKQDKLTAGDNITIENNVISATGGGGSSAPIEMYDADNDCLVKNADELYADYVAGTKLTYKGNNVVDFKETVEDDTLTWAYEAVTYLDDGTGLSEIYIKNAYGFNEDTTCIDSELGNTPNLTTVFSVDDAVSEITDKSTTSIPNCTAVKEYVAEQPKPISYSTEEQDTGLTWIDGKKIYQLTIQMSSSSSPATKTLKDNVENLISTEIIAQGVANSIYYQENDHYTFGDATSKNRQINVYLNEGTNTVCAKYNGATKPNGNYLYDYFTIRYTKTEATE